VSFSSSASANADHAHVYFPVLGDGRDSPEHHHRCRRTSDSFSDAGVWIYIGVGLVAKTIWTGFLASGFRSSLGCVSIVMFSAQGLRAESVGIEQERTELTDGWTDGPSKAESRKQKAII